MIAPEYEVTSTSKVAVKLKLFALKTSPRCVKRAAQARKLIKDTIFFTALTSFGHSFPTVQAAFENIWML